MKMIIEDEFEIYDNGNDSNKDDDNDALLLVNKDLSSIILFVLKHNFLKKIQQFS
jgi:hypothetical protein